MLTPVQIARRLEGITATDVAPVVGVHPERSPISVWQEKRGESPPWVDTDRTRWGDLLEPVIRADYAERHGMRIEVPGTLVHPDAEWMMASPDGVCYPAGALDPDRGLEIKCHTIRLAHLYGAPGTDEIPLHEICQDMWNMAVTGLQRWDHVVFLDGQPVEFTVLRDEELIGRLRELCERFLVDNVRGGVAPDPDGSEAFTDWLNRRWKASTGALIELKPDDEIHASIARAKQIRAEAADLEKEHETIIQALKLKLGEHEGMTWTNERGKMERITWKRNKPSRRIDHAARAGDMAADARLVMSGVEEVVDRALVCLERAGHDPIGSNSRAAITAREVYDLVQAMSRSLKGVSERTEAKYTTEVPGNRPFCFPRTWKAPASAKEQ
jgi:putative phage-type endonuclease